MSDEKWNKIKERHKWTSMTKEWNRRRLYDDIRTQQKQEILKLIDKLDKEVNFNEIMKEVMTIENLTGLESELAKMMTRIGVKYAQAYSYKLKQKIEEMK